MQLFISNSQLVFCVCVPEVRPCIVVKPADRSIEAPQLPAVGLTAGPVKRAEVVFVLRCSVAPSVQPGPCQPPCHICRRPVPAANPGSRVTMAGLSSERQVSASSRPADACYDGATSLKLSNIERRVISPTRIT